MISGIIERFIICIIIILVSFCQLLLLTLWFIRIRQYIKDKKSKVGKSEVYDPCSDLKSIHSVDANKVVMEEYSNQLRDEVDNDIMKFINNDEE